MCNQSLNELIQSAVEALGFTLWGVQLLSQGKSPLIRVYIDHDSGVGVDDCATVNRQIKSVLGVGAQELPEFYTLEVSSPGLNRQLFQWAQYHNYLGHRVSVLLQEHAQKDGRKCYKGVLVSVDEPHGIVLELEGQRINLSLSDVRKAYLLEETVGVSKAKQSI